MLNLDRRHEVPGPRRDRSEGNELIDNQYRWLQAAVELALETAGGLGRCQGVLFVLVRFGAVSAAVQRVVVTAAIKHVGHAYLIVLDHIGNDG
jgi:hypothetical protein